LTWGLLRHTGLSGNELGGSISWQDSPADVAGTVVGYKMCVNTTGTDNINFGGTANSNSMTLMEIQP